MDITLAKQLKDANFPTNPAEFPKGDWMITDQGEFYIPTLEELIEACGSKLELIIQQLDSWEAKSFDNKYGVGDTPKEAVADLWLMLND